MSSRFGRLADRRFMGSDWPICLGSLPLHGEASPCTGGGSGGGRLVEIDSERYALCWGLATSGFVSILRTTAQGVLMILPRRTQGL